MVPRTLLVLLAALCALCHTAAAYTLRGHLQAPGGAEPLALPPQTTVTLRSAAGALSTTVRADMAFAFVDVSVGSYILDVDAIDLLFPSLRIDVSAGDVEVYLFYRGNPWEIKGPRQPYPIELQPYRPAEYYQYREGFNVLKLFKNPMLLVSVVSLVMVFVLPKLMENMDPEALKELQADTATPNAITSAMNFDVASFMAGKAADSSAGTGSASGRAQPAGARSRKH
ncbi:uncharacterized protein V1510DRAFT_403856 [Dipodascopsis tothii]|uniref:uncharacterized protein n=1 Tax=Dipodascopsis tothii TaxID=44089 RepID=UPI0034CE9EC2